MVSFVSDPAVRTKIQRMAQRVCWENPQITDRSIDQRQLWIDDGYSDTSEAFSFLVLGDSGSGEHPGCHPQRQIAAAMAAHQSTTRFVLHTGDVVYLVGSSEHYLDNFIKPYREWLVGGHTPDQIPYDQMIFKQPFLPVLGNHDYYDLPLFYGALSKLASPLKPLLGRYLDLDIGWHGSYQGDAYARAFLDYLQAVPSSDLPQHLARHYDAAGPTGLCLRYCPGRFTRLPNRYYSFRYQGIDFFALDSNTFNEPEPLSDHHSNSNLRQRLADKYQALLSQQQHLVEKLTSLDTTVPEQVEQADYLRGKIEQITETARDLDKQCQARSAATVDMAQLQWLEERLVQSCQNQAVRGRILFFHHPPYVTEASKWHQGQTLAIRRRLRQVLDRVQSQVGPMPPHSRLVNLTLSGHAHCFEHLETLETGYGDAGLHWVVCGGSGYSLRRQRSEGSLLLEGDRPVAQSHRFVGKTGYGNQRRQPYSFLRIDVAAGAPLRLTLTPYVAERYSHQWKNYKLPPFQI